MAVFATAVLLFPVINDLLGLVWSSDVASNASGGAVGGIFGYLEYRRSRLGGLAPQHPVDRLATTVFRP